MVYTTTTKSIACFSFKKYYSNRQHVTVSKYCNLHLNWRVTWEQQFIFIPTHSIKLNCDW